jgi:actin cytoskeleton-regulatory complex protein PAN1
LNFPSSFGSVDLDAVLVPPPAATSASATASSSPVHVEHPDKGSADEGSNEGDSDYASLHDDDESDSDSDLDDDYPETSEERAAREKERQAVLEAAGLIVRRDVEPPPRPARKKSGSETTSSRRRRPAPAAPQRASISSISSKDLPPIPEPEPVDVNRHLDDAYDRYESFKKHKTSLSLHSIDLAPSVSPTASIATTSTAGPSKETDSTPRAYSQILNFLGRRTPANESESKPRLVISAPILSPPPGAGQEPARGASPAFGTVSGVAHFVVCSLVILLSHGQVWWTIRLWRVSLLTSGNGKRLGRYRLLGRIVLIAF